MWPAFRPAWCVSPAWIGNVTDVLVESATRLHFDEHYAGTVVADSTLFSEVVDMLVRLVLLRLPMAVMTNKLMGLYARKLLFVSSSHPDYVLDRFADLLSVLGLSSFINQDL